MGPQRAQKELPIDMRFEWEKSEHQGADLLLTFEYSRFHLVYRIPEYVNHDEERMLVSHMLSAHSGISTEEPSDHLSQLIFEARNRTASVSETAGEMLQSKL
jgi:DNA replicative helicase MCM subunit Mcm2 (Cdc46/Mcm family)